MTRLIRLALGISVLSVATANVALATPINIAPGGTASQSSVYAPGNEAYRGNDGDRTGAYPNTVHTNNDPNSFWQVAFANDYLISELLVFNRTDCCGERLDPFRLQIFNDNIAVLTVDVFIFSPTIIGPNISGASYLLGPGVVGDLVRLTLLSPNEYLNFAELEVMAEPVVAAVPEPASLLLLGTGLVGLARGFRKTR